MSIKREGIIDSAMGGTRYQSVQRGLSESAVRYLAKSDYSPRGSKSDCVCYLKVTRVSDLLPPEGYLVYSLKGRDCVCRRKDIRSRDLQIHQDLPETLRSDDESQQDSRIHDQKRVQHEKFQVIPTENHGLSGRPSESLYFVCRI